jgi:tetratricopeptide (TPR) repeat protein
VSYRPWSFVTEAIAERAERFRREGHHFAAALEWRALADLDDHHVRAAVRWAHHASRSGRVEAAAAAFFVAAGAAVRAGDPRRALLLARHALELAPAAATRSRLEPVARGCGPEGEALCTVAARLHGEAGRDDLALELHQLLSFCDSAAQTRAVTSRPVVSSGGTGEFVRVAEAMIARGRHDADTVLELARIYLRRGQPHAAVEKLELLRRVAPDRLAAAELLVHALLAVDRTRAALGVLQDVARRRPDATAEVRALFDRMQRLTGVAPDWARLVRAIADRVLVSGVIEVARPQGTPPPPPVWSMPLRPIGAR